jgi:hypothetical protein
MRRSFAGQKTRDHEPDKADADHADPHPRAGPHDGVSEPVVAKGVEKRPCQGAGCADGQKALERHAAGAREQSDHVAQPADEPADEQPGQAVVGELAPESLDAVRALAQATADAQEHLFAAVAADSERRGCTDQRADPACGDDANDRQAVLRSRVKRRGDQHGRSGHRQAECLQRHRDEHEHAPVLMHEVLYVE